MGLCGPEAFGPPARGPVPRQRLASCPLPAAARPPGCGAGPRHSGLAPECCPQLSSGFVPVTDATARLLSSLCSPPLFFPKSINPPGDQSPAFSTGTSTPGQANLVQCHPRSPVHRAGCGYGTARRGGKSCLEPRNQGWKSPRSRGDGKSVVNRRDFPWRNLRECLYELPEGGEKRAMPALCRAARGDCPWLLGVPGAAMKPARLEVY